MTSRRRFLSCGGVGMIALAHGCVPPGASASPVFADDSAGGALARLDALRPMKDRMLGYPINMNTPPPDFFEWRGRLFKAGVDEFAFNNVGNPFHESPIPYNTHDLERETVRSFGGRLSFPADDVWGFLSNSGTDSNMHGMYMGRTLLKARAGRTPKAFFTEEAHYSVQILRDLLGMEAVLVGTLPDGAMDAADLARKLAENAGVPALVVATVGTTFKGAVDDVDAIRRALAGRAGHLHVDAALFGGYLPYTPHRAVVAHGAAAGPGRYDSIAVSCHKFFGFPAPAGLFLTRRSLYEEFNARFGKIHNPEYVHHVPGTITCSRDSVKPAEFHYFTRPSSVARLTEDAGTMLENAAGLLDRMRADHPKLAAKRSGPLSNTVYFRHPGDEIVKKYSLATMRLDVDGTPTPHAHIVVMPHVGRAVMAEFLADLRRDGL